MVECRNKIFLACDLISPPGRRIKKFLCFALSIGVPAAHEEIVLNIMGHNLNGLDVPPVQEAYNPGNS